MGYNGSLKGLMTESAEQNAGEDTLQDCQDVVISQDSKIESRHGMNSGPVSQLTTFEIYDATNANVSVYKIPFSAAFQATSGYAKKYVLLSRTATSVYKMQEVLTTANLNTSMVTNNSTTDATNTFKPLAFAFGQSFYIMGTSGLQEMQIDVLNSGAAGVKKRINWPPFNDITIETFQDTQDFSTNWFNIGQKVGMRFTYVWNTSYNDETPREIESAPSQIFEVLHPMALRTQTVGSVISSTIKNESRVRVRIGANFIVENGPYKEFVTSTSNNRRFYIRIYRTSQVPISQTLPTEYAIAAPDIEIGGSTEYAFTAASRVSTANDTVDFTATESVRWKNGDLFRYDGTTIGGLTEARFYYLGQKSGNLFKIFNSPLVTAPIDLTAPAIDADQNFNRMYEINITVNDDALARLPKLYTNPNRDGEVNSNLVPPIANSLIEYKNHIVVANIREPLRAYVTMVKQPFVKNATGVTTIGPGIVAGNYFFDTFDILAPDGVSADAFNNTEGLTNGTPREFGIDSPLFRRYPPTNCTFSGNNVQVNGALSDLPITVSSTTSGSSKLFFDVNFVQKSAKIFFKFTQGATVVEIEGAVEPFYNRTSPYTRYRLLPGAFPYTGAIPLDNNLDFLQFGGTLDRPRYGAMPFYVTGGVTPLRTGITVDADAIGKTNIRGGKLPTVRPRNAAGTNTTKATTNITISDVDVAIGDLKSPGIFFYNSTGGTGYFSYKTFTVTAINSIQFNEVVHAGIDNVGARTFFGYAIDASTPETANLYFQESPLTNTKFIDWISGIEANSPIFFSPVPLTGYYNTELGTTNSVSRDSSGKLPNPTFKPLLARSPAQLLSDSAKALVQTLNIAASQVVSIAGKVNFVVSPDVAGEFYVEFAGGDKIESRIVGDYHSYEPEIIRSTTVYTTLAEYKQNNIRALCISRHNAPESFPATQVLGPQLIGSDKSAIVALAKNADDCFILKEDGIWRMTIPGKTSTGLPFEPQITQIDTTTYCQTPHSVQEINEEVIFLSQKGFISIAGNSIQAIGRNIETEVKEKLQRSISKGLAGQIRSWVNEEKRVYGCTIPDTTVSFTTYIFNTYTREWTKSSLPILDATTDSEGRTTFLVGKYARTLESGATFQEQINNSSTGTLQRFLLTEEIHTDGQYRNELDQYDYFFKPAIISINGDNDVVLVEDIALSFYSRVGGATAPGTDITFSGLSFFVNQQAYWSQNGVLHPVIILTRNVSAITVRFPNGWPEDISRDGNNGLYVGVPASVTFNPTSVGTPDTNKQFSEYMVHVDEAISSLQIKFKTDSQASFSTTRTFAFNTVAVNRSIYRTFIPITACRGRWFIRQVSHEVPLERLVITAQTINVRETGSSRIQKAPR